MSTDKKGSLSKLSNLRNSLNTSKQELYNPQQSYWQKKFSQTLYKKLSEIEKQHDREQDNENDNQSNIKLQDQELPGRQLMAKNPNQANVIVRYNMGSKELNKQEFVSSIQIHYQQTSQIILQNSDEYKMQEDYNIIKEKNIRQVSQQYGLSKNNGFLNEESDSVKQSIRKNALKIIRNNFNYGSNQISAPAKQIKTITISTVKPKQVAFSFEVNQYTIYEAYLNYCKINNMERLIDLGIVSKEKLKGKQKYNHLEKKEGQIQNENENDNENIISPEELKETYENSTNNNCKIKLMERMVLQNDQIQKYKDYRYMYTQENNELYKVSDKLLFPLWRFSNNSQQKCSAVVLQWNKKYQDLFACSFEALDSEKNEKKSSFISIFSIKNTIYPEKTIRTTQTVICMDFHQEYSHILAVGTELGEVMVYDNKRDSEEPIYKASTGSTKHTESVNQVKWSTEKNQMNFYSVSSDGRVFNWYLLKSCLESEEIYKLNLVQRKNDKSKSHTKDWQLFNGLCFDFNPLEKLQMIVGTEEGLILLSSCAYQGEYLSVFESHSLAVYQLQYNPFDPEYFISCSADWTVKIWKTSSKKELLSFELGMPLVDVQWSPFVSSVFFVLSLEKSHVFDIGKNKYEAIYENKPVRSKCVNLAANTHLPLLIISDQSGGISSYKISSLIVPQENIESVQYKEAQKLALQENIKQGAMTQ